MWLYPTITKQAKQVTFIQWHNTTISRTYSNEKGLNIEVTTGQYQLLYNLICDAYDRGYDQRPSIDTQTFDNLFDNVCNAKETYLSINCKGVRQIVEGKIELQEAN